MDRIFRQVEKFGRLLGRVSFLGFILNAGVKLWLVSQFIAAPTVPEPSQGRVIAFNNHGVDHYITYGEHQLDVITWVVGGTLLATMLLGQLFAGKNILKSNSID